MAIRDCVRRHGRLPEIIVVDGGPDFRSAGLRGLQNLVHHYRDEKSFAELNTFEGALKALSQWGYRDLFFVNLTRHGVDWSVIRCIIPSLMFGRDLAACQGN